MKYNFYRLNNEADFKQSNNRLHENISKYLENCEKDIYQCWRKNYDIGVLKTGLSYFFNSTVLKNIKEINKTLIAEELKYFIEDSLFQHRNAFYGKLVDILLNDNIEQKKVLLITQEEKFKKKFNYDSSAITMDLVKKRTQKFFNRLGIQKIPEIYCIAFLDTPKITTSLDYVTRNDKKELILNWHEE